MLGERVCAGRTATAASWDTQTIAKHRRRHRAENDLPRSRGSKGRVATDETQMKHGLISFVPVYQREDPDPWLPTLPRWIEDRLFSARSLSRRRLLISSTLPSKSTNAGFLCAPATLRELLNRTASHAEAQRCRGFGGGVRISPCFPWPSRDWDWEPRRGLCSGRSICRRRL